MWVLEPPGTVRAMSARRLPRPALLAAVVTGALALGACSGGGEAKVPDDANVVVGALDSLTFDAKSYTAPAGEVKIAYVNKGAVGHTLLVVSPEAKQLGERLEIGARGVDSGTYTLEPGTYTLFCDIPGHSSMKATLTLT